MKTIKLGKIVIDVEVRRRGPGSVHFFKITLNKKFSSPGVTLKVTMFGVKLKLSVYKKIEVKPRQIVLPTCGCPYWRDAGECLRRQGEPGAGGSFGSYCECECHRR